MFKIYQMSLFDKVIDSPFSGTSNEYLTIKNILLLVLISLIIGVILSLTYYFLNKKAQYHPAMPVLNIVMPAIVAISIFMVSIFIEGNNFARALTLGGLFALVKFRSDPVSLKDMMNLTIGIICGLVVGLGYFLFAFIVCFLFVIIQVVAKLIKYGEVTNNDVILRILVPENVEYDGLFDVIFKKYASNYYLIRVKTTDFGTLFELKYALKLKKGIETKALIDELRVINSNMSIAIALREK